MEFKIKQGGMIVTIINFNVVEEIVRILIDCSSIICGNKIDTCAIPQKF